MKVCEESMQQRVTTMKTAQDKRVNEMIAGDEHTQVITVVPPLPEERTTPKAASDRRQQDVSQLKPHPCIREGKSTTGKYHFFASGRPTATQPGWRAVTDTITVI
jgi:hypothetical protein